MTRAGSHSAAAVALVVASGVSAVLLTVGPARAEVEESFKLTPSDGAAGDSFGASVGISGNTAIVGAAPDDDNGTSSGSAYLFDTITGRLTAKLTPADGAEFDQFGEMCIRDR